MSPTINIALTLKRIFPGEGNKQNRLAILVDIPDQTPDNEKWQKRRELAFEWFSELKKKNHDFCSIEFIVYKDVGTNNGELPDLFYFAEEKLPFNQFELENFPAISREELFASRNLFIAPTEFSTTAPLKNLAKKYLFRAATMPGFSMDMLPACEIDYQKVYERTTLLKEKLDAAQNALIDFQVDNRDNYQLLIDLRFRSAHLSAGVFDQPGMVGNFPSGETYIVPYEGEQKELSQTAGLLPVQLGREIIIYKIKENIAVEILGEGPEFEKERQFLSDEPFYGNIAELGLGVLADFGIKPINEILLDEKLGVHIAFGRSDHFGGAVGPSRFNNPARVIHLDRIFIEEIQPRVKIKKLTLIYETLSEDIMLDGKYLCFQDSSPLTY